MLDVYVHSYNRTYEYCIINIALVNYIGMYKKINNTIYLVFTAISCLEIVKGFD